MPKRSNSFQKLIFFVKQQVAEDAVVTESKYLQDFLSGADREVDICIERVIGGHKIIISIECRDHKRKADVKWIEEMKSKHERLPTNALVLVSKMGFTKEAKTIADKYGIETLTIEEVNEETTTHLFGNHGSVWAKLVALNPTKVVIRLLPTDDLPSEDVLALPDNIVFSVNKTPLTTIKGLVTVWLKSERFMEQIVKDANETHKGFSVRCDNPSDKDGSPIYLLKQDPIKMRQIEFIEISGECSFEVNKFTLEHGILGETRISWGTSNLKNKSSLLIATEDETGNQRLTITQDNLN